MAPQFCSFLRQGINILCPQISQSFAMGHPRELCMHDKSLQSCLIFCHSTDKAPLSMRFSRQGYWSGLLCPPLEDLPNPGIKPESLTSPAFADRFFTAEPREKPQVSVSKGNSLEKSASMSQQ